MRTKPHRSRRRKREASGQGFAASVLDGIAIGENQQPLRVVGEPGVLGFAEEQEPGSDPDDSDEACDDKRAAPAGGMGGGDDERGGQDCPHGRTAGGCDAHGEAALTLGKPFEDAFGGAGEAAAFTRAEHETEEGKLGAGLNHGVQQAGDGPEDDADAEAHPGSGDINEAPSDGEHDAIGQRERGDGFGILDVGETQILENVWREDGENLTVEEAEGRGDKQQAGDDPAESRRRGHSV